MWELHQDLVNLTGLKNTEWLVKKHGLTLIFFKITFFFLFLNIETNQLLALLRFQINPYEKCNKDLVDLTGPKEYWIIGKKKMVWL